MEVPGSTAASPEVQEVVAVLEATLSPNTEAVAQAQKLLDQAAESKLEELLVTLAQILANSSNSPTSRTAAGLFLKNQLTSKDPADKLLKQQRWAAFKLETRKTVRELVLNTLGTEHSTTRSAAQVLAYIACVEQVMNEWPELMPLLANNVVDVNSTPQLKEASLEAVGYICEELDHKFLVNYSNEILTAVISGIKREEQSTVQHMGVCLAATKALYHMLELCKPNFEKETERHFIMQVLCEATQYSEVKVVVAALQNMVKIMSLYYQHMEMYMGPALFAITLNAMKSTVDEVALQGIEFWSTVCDEEADLAVEAAEAEESGIPPTQNSRFYVKGAMTYIVPVLLEKLTVQEEFDDEDEWNPCKAAGVCLSLVSGCCGADLFAVVSPFILENIHHAEWNHRDAAVMALGSALEGAEEEEACALVDQLMGPLLELVKDTSVQVRDSVAWTVGRVCERCPKALLKKELLPTLLESLLFLLEGEARVAVNTCWAISSLVEAAHDSVAADSDVVPETFLLSETYSVFLEKLLATADRTDSGSGNLRNAAFEALMDMVKYSPGDTYKIVQQLATIIISRLTVSIEHFKTSSGAAQKQAQTELLCLLLAAVQSLLRRLSKENVIEMGDMVVLLLVSAGKIGEVLEDVMMTFGVLIEVMGSEFRKHCPVFFPILLAGMGNTSDVQVCLASIGLVGDVCQNLGADILSIAADLMTLLVSILTHNDTDKSLKPPILSAFGDVAMALGSDFVNYVDGVLLVLQQAMALNIVKSDYDVIEYVNQIRDSVLEAFTGILQGATKGSSVAKEMDVTNNLILLKMSPLINDLLQYMVLISVDEDRSDSNLSGAIGLLGDLCSIPAFRPITNFPETTRDSLLKLLLEGKRSRTKRTRLLADWASKEFKVFIQLQTVK